MSKAFQFVVPPLVFPCGEQSVIPVDAIAVLRSAGVERIRFPSCWKCGEEHIVSLPDISTIDTVPQSELLVSPLARAG